MRQRTIEDFYKETSYAQGKTLSDLLPGGINKEIGHFNAFNTQDVIRKVRERHEMPYDRRAYYKISLIRGRNRVEYADKVIDIERNALLFATPKVPYRYVPLDEQQGGDFCVFTEDFMVPSKTGVVLDELPLFRAGGFPILQLSDEEAEEIQQVFRKVHKDLASDYAYKYDLLRNYVLELIHYGQKLQPATAVQAAHSASARVSSLFIELLERQFPIDSANQRLSLRAAKDYADRLSVHVNHLNKVLKETTGKTTTEIIAGRIAQEARILLKQTSWNISEIAYSLGFEEVSHFSNFFKKQAGQSPALFRA